MREKMLRMNKKLIISIVFACFFAGFFFFLLKDRNEHSLNSQPVTQENHPTIDLVEDCIVFIGDERLEKCDWRSLMQCDKIYNLSQSQNTIKDEYNRLDYLFGEVHPSQVVVMLGLRDLMNKIPVNQVYADFVQCIETMQSRYPQTEIIILPILPVDYNMPVVYNSLKEKDIEAFNLLVKLYALEKGLSYVSMANDLKGTGGNLRREYSQGDGLSFSDAAYYVMKDRLSAYLRLN